MKEKAIEMLITIPGHAKKIAKSKWSWATILIVVILSFYIAFKMKTTIDSIKYGLTPPELPEYQQITDADTFSLNPTGWSKDGGRNSDWFHHASQGTATIPIPYQWLIALEEPKSNPWFIFFSKEDTYTKEYILRLGFIKQKVSQLNPDALPIGIAKTESMYFPGIDRKATAAGFTCAACHTGQIIYKNKRFVVDGGPSMVDLGLLTKSLGAALGQTVLSSKLPILNGRFKRFAQKVLGDNNNILTKKRLKEELAKTILELGKSSDVVNVTEGFTRLDALNRIGNQVFNADITRKANYSPIDAPVNYPHIWTTSWFNWVQYDGSIMQPLVRNSGEASGVKAYIDATGPNSQRFASSINIDNLIEIENWLGGTHPSKNKNQFNGLLAPKWPKDFPDIDTELANKGDILYKEICQGCHLPSVKTEQFWSNKYWKKIQYVKKGKSEITEETYLHLNIIPVVKIGTDPAQSGVLTNRTVDTTGLDLNTDVCTWVMPDDPTLNRASLTYATLNDSASSNFGLALDAFVGRTNQQWFDQNYVAEARRPAYEGHRPNCLQTDKGYKARPLNGIWATAPFLHNGSIATIYDLLSPLSERPTFVQLGSQAFDAEHIGIVQNEAVQSLNAIEKEDLPPYEKMPDYSDGLFILDTRQPGNSNTGHIFDDLSGENEDRGKIGKKLSDDEKLALIEYLKTL